VVVCIYPSLGALYSVSKNITLQEKMKIKFVVYFLGVLAGILVILYLTNIYFNLSSVGKVEIYLQNKNHVVIQEVNDDILK
jgi:hypothetical protein